MTADATRHGNLHPLSLPTRRILVVKTCAIEHLAVPLAKIRETNTEAEIDYVADRVVETVQRLRELSPLYEMAKEGVDLKQVKWAAE